MEPLLEQLVVEQAIESVEDSELERNYYMRLEIVPLIKSLRSLRKIAIVYLVFTASGHTTRPTPTQNFNIAFRAWLKEEAYFGRPVGKEEALEIYERELKCYLAKSPSEQGINY